MGDKPSEIERVRRQEENGTALAEDILPFVVRKLRLVVLPVIDKTRLETGKGLHDPRGFEADPDHLADEPHDIFGVVGAVGVGADVAALVFRYLVLVDHPLGRAAVGQAIFECLRRVPASVRVSFILSERRSFESRSLSSTRYESGFCGGGFTPP